MNVVDIIEKKKDGKPLDSKELVFVVNGFVKGEISDAQMSALLMAICIKGMSDEEVFYLTKAMVDSGSTLDLSDIDGIKVDKHSTGGVGDKTSLVVGPIVAACGVPVAKLSGRALGHTGGTIDKLESIRGFKTELTNEEFIKQVKEVGLVDASQTSDLVPADKLIYALRSVTGTTKSIPLIASSIMSKKIAAGADKIVLDVKTGKGALVSNLDDSIKLAELMVSIGTWYGKETIAVISDMTNPLGLSIGNGLEIKEAVKILNGEGEDEITKLCLTLSTYMISMGKKIDEKEARGLAIDALYSKRALSKFQEFIKAQGGDLEAVSISNNTLNITSNKDGYINEIDALKLANVTLKLKAGRINKEDQINHGTGIVLTKTVGDEVKKGDIIAIVYYDDKMVYKNEILDAFNIVPRKLGKHKLIHGVIKSK